MKVLALVPILIMVLVAGCVGQAPASNTQTPGTTASPQLRESSLVIFHTGYQPSSFTVNKGDTVRILAKTAPGTETHHHGVTIDAYAINQVVLSSTDAVTIQFVADKAGTFPIYCGTCKDGIFGAGHPDIRASLIVQG